MFFKDFKIQKKVFRKRKLSILQHKLRVLMKCYTIVDFDLDYDTSVFTFKKTHKVNGIKINDPKEYSGRFEVQDVDNEEIVLRIIAGENKKDKNNNAN